MATAQIIGADGQPYEIPAENLNAALAIPGTKRAVATTGPDGKGYWLPSDKVQEAVTSNGFKLGQPAANAFETRAQNDPEGGGLTRLGRGLGAMVTSPALLGPAGVAYMTGKRGLDELQSYRQTGKTLSERRVDEMRAAGHGVPYMVDSAAAEGLGVNVPGMERAADVGNTSGVVGEAAVVPTAMGLTYGAMKALPKTASMAGKASSTLARQAVEDTLRPLPKMYRFGKDPAGFVLDNNITANSLPDLKTGIDTAVEAKISQLNDVLAKATKPVDLAPVAQDLQQAISRAKLQRNVPLVRQLTQLYNERFSGRPMQVPATEAAEIKRGIQDSISWDTDSPGLSNVKKQMQHQVAQQIYKVAPDAAPLSEQISSGIEASKAAERQALRSAAGGGMAVVRPGMIGAGLGTLATGQPLAGAAAYTLAENALRRPMLATRVASGLNSVARGGRMVGTLNPPAGAAAITAPLIGSQKKKRDGY